MEKEQFDFFLSAPTATIQEAIPRTADFIAKNSKIACSISGGADSDVMLDLVYRLDTEKKVQYIFFNTGIEMSATLEHLDFLENKYGIKILRPHSNTKVPAAVKKYGYPFLSKRIATYIGRLQRHGFQWEDKPFELLELKYPKCRAALKWWCNAWGEKSGFNISKNLFLKEFIMDNPPPMLISEKCCLYSKKKIAYAFNKENEIGISLIGIRKAEGGARQTIKSCFLDGSHGMQHFPLFWFTDEDKECYEKTYNVQHSRAYTQYSCTRTGCAGCPFGSNFEQELKMLHKHEPKLYNVALRTFEPSIRYTRQYRSYKTFMADDKKRGGQTLLTDYL